MRKKILSKKVVATACRMYRFNTQAAKALGIQVIRFRALCEQYNLETPTQQIEREKVERRMRQKERHDTCMGLSLADGEKRRGY